MFVLRKKRWRSMTKHIVRLAAYDVMLAVNGEGCSDRKRKITRIAFMSENE
jgi:hypothetical protein